MEDIITDYVSLLGYNNLPKNIGRNGSRDTLNTDQLFTDFDDSTLFLVEQKIRDDHDSTKKEDSLATSYIK